MAGVGADGVAGGRRCGAADEEAPSQYWGGRPYKLPLAAAALAAAAVLPPEAGVAGRAPGRLLAGALAAAAPAEIAAREEAAAEAAVAAAVAVAAEEADEEEADDRVADDEVEGEVAARAGSLVGELMGSMR
jgi:hypothetical protein